MESVSSKGGIPIRLTDERWEHIVYWHPELDRMKDSVLGVLQEPDSIYQNDDGSCLAVDKIGRAKWLCVAYREDEHDGFIITAFTTNTMRTFKHRSLLWPQ